MRNPSQNERIQAPVFMSTYETFSRWIDDTIRLREQRKQTEQAERHQRLRTFNAFIDELAPLYEIHRDEFYKTHIAGFVEKHPYLNHAGILDVIGKASHETYHSKLLKHAWACTPEGRKRLVRFIGSLRDIPDRERLLADIARDPYEIETEHVCRRWNKDAFHDKRIDLLIRGNGWQIVIENKIRSEVATIRRHTQLDNYRRYVEKTMPDDYERTLFILLSHRDNSAYCGDCWHYADYSHVFNSLIASPTDPLIENYLATLFRFLSPDWATPDSQQGRMLSSLKRFYRKNILKLQSYE